MMDWLTDLLGHEGLWEQLCRRRAEGVLPPVFLYGMGDGADKALAVLGRLNIPVEGVFASDEFVRGQSFRGFPVKKYGEVRKQYPCFVALLCFAVDYEPMLSRVTQIAEEAELYVPDLPIAGLPDELFDRNYILEYQNEFNNVYCRLADEESRRVFRGLMAGRLTGEVPSLRAVESSREAAWRELLHPCPEDCFLDLGAYNGDTIRDFLRLSGGSCRSIDAMEPDPKNYEKLLHSLGKLPNARAWNIAAGSVPGVAYARRGRRGRGSGISANGTIPIEINSVDNLLDGRFVTVAKLDVEGAEADALRGMERTIHACRPRMAVCAYHRNEDLFRLPGLVLEMEPSYRVYLRKHPYLPGWESVFYFV